MDQHIRHDSPNKSDAHNALEQLRNMKKTLPSLLQGDKDLREDILFELQQLTYEVETPWQTLRRVFWYAPWNSITIDIAVNMGIFQHLISADKALSAPEIASKCNNAEIHFTQRLLRCMNAFGSVKQHWVGNEAFYSANKVSHSVSTPFGEAVSRWITEFMSPAWHYLPQMLKERGYKSLTSGTDTVFNKLHNAPGRTVYEIVGQSPYIKDVGTFMAQFNTDHKDWTEIYPVRERLVKGAAKNDGSVFMVDCGGATGSQVVAARRTFPEAPGKFVVLDLPLSIPSAPPPDILTCGHDFFQPFPTEVHGARLYYMRYISHNWSQEALVKILTNIKAAMKPGYSKLIINDWIVPERNPHPFMCSQDLLMMHLGGGEERSEARHREAIEAAGLKVSGVFRAGDQISEDVIECEVAGCACACSSRPG